MSRYFVHDGTSYQTYEQARAAARTTADSTNAAATVEVWQDDRMQKVYTYQPSGAQHHQAAASVDPSLTERVANLEAALAEALSRISALEAKPRRSTKSKAA